MRKKLLAGVLAAALGASVLAGCTNSTGNNSTTTAATTAATTEAATTEEATTEEATTEEATTEEATTEASNAGDTDLSGSLSDIVDAVYAEKEVGLKLQTNDVDLTDENALRSFTGLTSADGIAEAVASEPMMSSQAYSFVLVRVEDSARTADVAAEMLAGIDTRKWICVMADDLQVAYCDDLIMLFMVETGMSDVVTSDEMVAAFETVCGGEVTVIK